MKSWRDHSLLLGTCACILLTFIIVVLPAKRKDGTDRNALFSPEDLKKDPSLGSVVAGIDVKQFPHAGKRVVLMAMGECTSCAVHGFDPDKLRDARKVFKIAVFDGPAASKEIDEQPLTKAFDTVVHLTHKDYLKLNPVLPDRIYIVDKSARLLALQQPADAANEFLSRWTQ